MNLLKKHSLKIALVAFIIAVIRSKGMTVDLDLLKNFTLGVGLFVVVMSVLVIVHEFSHFLVGKYLGAEPTDFSVGMGQKLYSFKWLGADFHLSALPIGGYVRFSKVQFDGENGQGTENSKISPSRWIWIALAGPVSNLVISYIVFFGLVFVSLNHVKVSNVESSSNSEISVGDQVVTIEGASSMSNVLRKMIAKGDENTQGFVLLSDYKTKPVQDLSQLAKEVVYSSPLSLSLMDKISYSSVGTLKLFKHFTVSTANAIGGLFTDPKKNYSNISGPIGIGAQLKHTYTLGIEYVWIMFGAISFSLGFMNLLPLSVLDGGRILMAVYQSAVSENISDKFLNVLNIISVSGLVLLMLAGTIADLVRL